VEKPGFLSDITLLLEFRQAFYGRAGPSTSPKQVGQPLRAVIPVVIRQPEALVSAPPDLRCPASPRRSHVTIPRACHEKTWQSREFGL